MKILLFAGKNGRAVIFGTVKNKPVPGQPVELTNARMIINWSCECGGIFGLAANGPKTDTQISAVVKCTTETVWQESITVSPEAAKEIEKWPVA